MINTSSTLTPMISTEIHSETTTTVKTGRAKFTDRRPAESLLAYEQRLAERRSAESKRQRERYAALKATIETKVLDTLQTCKDQGTIMCQADAVELAVLTTSEAFSKPDNRTILPAEYVPGKARITRDAGDILASLTTAFNRGFSKSNKRTYDLSETRIARISRDEAIYRNMNPAERSKSDPFQAIRTLNRVESKRYAGDFRRFVPSSLEIFTQAERMKVERKPLWGKDLFTGRAVAIGITTRTVLSEIHSATLYMRERGFIPATAITTKSKDVLGNRVQGTMIPSTRKLVTLNAAQLQRADGVYSVYPRLQSTR